MRSFSRVILVSATVITVASAYGYKYNRNPYTGECQLQLNLPGGTGQNAYRPGVGIKDAYPGIMNTRYGSDDGQYHGNNYHGAASSHHTALASGSSHHGAGSSHNNNHYQGNDNTDYGSGSGRFPSSSGGSYGAGSNYGSSSSENAGASSNGFEAPGSFQSNKYGGGSSGNTNYQSGSGNRGSSTAASGGGNYGNDYDNGNYGSAAGSSGSYGSSNTNYESSNRESNFAAASSSERDRVTGSHRPSNPGHDRNQGVHSNNNHRNPVQAQASSNSNNFDRNTGNYGSSSNNREAASSSYGASASSGHRESSSSSEDRRQYNNNRHQGSSSSGHRGSGGSYGGASSSAESLGSNNGGNWKQQQQNNKNYGSSGGGDADVEYLDRRFGREVLLAHNSYRARHDTPPVLLDEEISIRAQEWANELATGRAVYGHSPHAVEGIYGESLQVMNVADPTGTELVDHWYQERRNFNFRDPRVVKTPRSKRNSHFTAIVWKATRKIGVGKATSNDGRTFIVVSYYPPGNIVDVLEDNVLPPRPGSSKTREPIY